MYHYSQDPFLNYTNKKEYIIAYERHFLWIVYYSGYNFRYLLGFIDHGDCKKISKESTNQWNGIIFKKSEVCESWTLLRSETIIYFIKHLSYEIIIQD